MKEEVRADAAQTQQSQTALLLAQSLPPVAMGTTPQGQRVPAPLSVQMCEGTCQCQLCRRAVGNVESTGSTGLTVGLELTSLFQPNRLIL